MSGLHEAFDEIVADVPVYGDLDKAIEQADRERRHRYGVVAGLAAAAAVGHFGQRPPLRLRWRPAGRWR